MKAFTKDNPTSVIHHPECIL